MSLTESFLRDGMVAVEGALDPAFCEEVVARRLAGIGVVEEDRSTWRTGWHNLPATTTYPLVEVAPRAAEALHELVGGPGEIEFGDLPDNLILNFPDPQTTWWGPEEWDAPGAGWHKDGDWFRHFLDSPEQGLLGIVFWRDVDDRMGPTYVAADSLAPMAHLLAQHPEGIDPSVPVRDIVAASTNRRALVGRQGTIVWAHPFLVHTASVNASDRLRVISNTSVLLARPLRLDSTDPVPVARVVLDALGVDSLDFRPTRERHRIVPDRERRWRESP
jgi:hypothetical protein